MLQIPATPGRETAWLVHGGDVIGGYVVKAEDVTWATTPAQLYAVHGLGFPGSPFSADMPFIDVVRFPEAFDMVFTTPFGRPSDASPAEVNGPFVDHPPFRGLGFTTGGDRVAPMWWLDPVRLPPRSELWRVHSDGRQLPLAVYPDVARGWTPVEGLQVQQTFSLRPSDVLGATGLWRGQRVLADDLGDGTTVVGSAADIPGAGLVQTRRGVWTATVPSAEVTEVHSLRLTATWRGLPFQVVGRNYDGETLVGQIVYLGRNALEAEGAGLQKLDAGYYQAFVPMQELTEVSGIETSRGPARVG
jgi:hypothetical protein